MRRLFASLAFFFGLCSAPSAEPILDVQGGLLVGARNVQVNNVFYNVRFVDGTCAQLFSGCDESADFLFQSQIGAADALVALFGSVFVDGPDGNFDSMPELTRGCTWTYACNIHVPISVSGETVTTRIGINFEDGLGDGTNAATTLRTVDLNGAISETFAVFSFAVPEPGSLPLIGVGLAGVAALRRRRA